MTSSTAAALRALLDHRLPRMKDPGRGIGVRLERRWSGEHVLHLGGGEDLPVHWCESPLAAREAMVARRPSARPWLLLTPLDERALGDDVLARLDRCRLHRLDRWQILRNRLSAHRVDPRLSRYPWLAEAMLEVLPASHPGVTSGFLDATTAWGILLEGHFGLRQARPDLRALLAWSYSSEHRESGGEGRPAAATAIGRCHRPELLAEATAWIRESAGEAGARVFAMAEDGRARDALPLGIVLETVFGAGDGDGDDPDLRVAAARLERFVDSRPIPPAVGRHWGREAAADLRRRISAGDGDPRARRQPAASRRDACTTILTTILERAETIAREIELGAVAARSRFLPSAQTGRWQSLASALAGNDARLLERARSELAEHALLTDDERDAARRLVRLKRWLLRGERELPASMPGFGKWALEEGWWVDRLRDGLRARPLPSNVEPAAEALLAAADRRRQDLNRAFGRQLAGWLSSGAPASGPSLESERLLPEVLAPLAASGPVLLVLLDGLSGAVFLELLPGIQARGWRQLAAEAPVTRGVLVAPLPTVTDRSRCSLLAGRLLRGTQGEEVKAFSSHPGLRAAGAASRPPRLIHKRRLEGDAGGLSPELRELILDPDQRVVGVVVNAIDDQLSGSDQVTLRWGDSILRPLEPLLTSAAQAGRRVVIAGDHGHVLESGTVLRRHHGGGARWRPATDEAADDEVRLEGPRVLTDDRRMLAPWSEKVRYGGKSAGYHGGASPQEVLVPFAAFCFGGTPSGWLEVEPEAPPWWHGEEETNPRPPVAAAARDAPDDPQLGLFPPAEPARQPGAAAAASWIAQLMTSEVLAGQRPLAGRAGLDDQRLRTLLIALEQRGGKATRPALARATGQPAGRLRGFLALVQKLLNVDGFPVLEIDEASDTVIFNRQLLISQFELDP